LKILQAMAGAPHGGAEAFFDRLVGALARANIEQRVLTRDHPERLEKLRAAGLEPVVLRFGGLLDRHTRRSFAEQIRGFAPDIVLTWMSRASGFCPRAADLGVRFVHVARLGGYYDPKHFRACDHLIANTPDIRDWLVAQKFAPERVHHLPNFVAAVPQPAVARASLDTPEGAPLVLGLGRLHPNKAWDVLLDAVACLPTAYLWIAGEGPEAAALAKRAAKLGIGARVRWLGWRTDVPALLAAADVLVCASRHEPLGNVVIEAWAHSVPVVAAASQGPRGLIRDGTDGLLAPVDDPAALAAAIERVLGERALAGLLARAGRARYEAAFTESAVVRQYLEFFNRVAG
jgi:glycosyltransferase involved in cell wall biosynthesis